MQCSKPVVPIFPIFWHSHPISVTLCKRRLIRWSIRTGAVRDCQAGRGKKSARPDTVEKLNEIRKLLEIKFIS